MKKLPIVVVVAAVVVIAVFVAMRTSGPGPSPVGPPGPGEATSGVPEPHGAVVFDLQYRGFDTPDDPLSYRSYWGFGGPPEANDPFVQAVRSRVKECTPVYHGSLPKTRWSVVELEDKKPVAFYFDANADGQLSDHEKFLPTKPSGSEFGYPHAFLTSDFLIQTEDNREIPFRVMLVGSSYGSEISYMWSPCCVLEGEAPLAGKPTKMILYANGFSGSFTTFGSCSYALIPARQKSEGYISRDTLSSLLQHEGKFYHLKFDGVHEKGRTLRVVLEKDTTPTGQIAVEVKGQDALQARLTSMSIDGTADPSIHFGLSNAQSTLPAGQYKLSRGWLSYGTGKDAPWRVDFDQGPGFDVTAGKTSTIKLGKLALSLRAVDEQERYRSDVKERTTFAKGTAIYLTPEIKGEASEVYMRFSQQETGSNRRADVKPHLAIAGPDGKQIVSADLEYG